MAGHGGEAIAAASAADIPESRLSRYRWIILFLVVSATTINYVDRQIIALLKPLLEDEFGWNDRDYGHMVSGFQFAAAAAYLWAGWFVDRLGVRIGYPFAVAVWSAAAMAHAAARSVAGFVTARVVLGVSEAVNTPAAVKTIAEWFPLRERALALGFMNTGSNMGAIVAPLIVPPMAIAFGWQAAFIITGALGFLWIAGWFLVQRSRHVPQPAREAVSGATRAPAVAWGPLLRDRRVWAIGIAKMLSDAVWWFLLFWLPDFLHRVYNLDLKSFGLPLATIYTLATVGALFGGVLPAYLLKRGASVNAARKLSLLVSAIAVMPVPLVLGMTDYWNAVLLVGLALAAHQAFSTNVFALAVDMFGDGRVGTVVGIGALLGNIGGLAMLEFTAWTLDRTGSYLPMFLYAASAYVVALGLIQILAPRVDALGARA